jgi:hypothetical protein
MANVKEKRVKNDSQKGSHNVFCSISYLKNLTVFDLKIARFNPAFSFTNRTNPDHLVRME